MSHILDNPVWAAVATANQNLSIGNDEARYIRREISSFAGIRKLVPANFQALHEVIPFAEPIGFFSNEPIIYPNPWKISARIDGYQLIYPKVETSAPGDDTIIKLTEEYVPEMLDLTKMTNPGPFYSKTILFGKYEGILLNGKLIAMAGQRLHSGNYVEISAVCTHPDHVGKGLARKLILSQIRQIQTHGEVPYLHVRGDNSRAIDIYHNMGFETRSKMIIYMLSKNL